MSDKKRKLTGIHYSQWEHADQDYLDQLSDEEFEFIQQFNQEYYSAKFGKKPIHKNVKAAKRDAWERQNEARRGIWLNGDRVAKAPSSYRAKLTTADLDIEELYDHYGLEVAGEMLVMTIVDEMSALPREAKIERMKGFIAKFEELKTIARKVNFTRNKKHKRGKK